MNDSTPISPTALLIGTSRGIGYSMAAEFVKRGWNVVGTVRGDARTQLHDLKDAHPGQITIEQVDITDAGQLRALNGRL